MRIIYRRWKIPRYLFVCDGSIITAEVIRDDWMILTEAFIALNGEVVTHLDARMSVKSLTLGLEIPPIPRQLIITWISCIHLQL